MHNNTLNRSTKSRHRGLEALAGWVGLVLLATATASAGDGRVEINQVRALAGGVTPGDAAGFPVTIDEPGSYVLTGDLSVSDPAVTAIEIRTNGVFVDLAGHALVGPRSCTGEGASIACDITTPGGDGVDATSVWASSIRNGTVRGFYRGLNFADGSGCRVERMHLARNSLIGLQGGVGCVVLESLFERNGGWGVTMGDSMLSHAVVVGNGAGGASFNGSVITAGTFRSNAGTGVSANYCSVVTDSTASENGIVGIEANYGSIVLGNASTLNVGWQLRANDVTTGWARNALLTDPGTTSSSTLAGGVQIGPNVCDGAICP